MKSLGNFPDPFIAEIAGQPDALRRAAAGLADQLPVLKALAGTVGERTLVFTGMGSSYDVCYPAVAQLARAGIPAIHVDAAELLHFRRNLLGPSALLVAVSQSGESAEVVRVIDVDGVEDGPVVVAVTNGVDSTLAHAADLALDTRAGEEIGPSTMTFAGALVVVAAIGRTLAGERPDAVVARLVDDADSAAAAIERLLDLPSLPDELASWLDDRGASVILGRGPARAAAEMGALTLKEAVGLPIESLETAQFRHGPLELAGPDLAAMLIATEPETFDLDVRLAGELVASGASVLIVTGAGDGPAEALRIPIGSLDSALAPAASILPAQLLAWKLAVRRGRSPGAYRRASKVTTRE
jgi:glucosamine--fructose-6-phosphate aminotransferase (isomerizing)